MKTLIAKIVKKGNTPVVNINGKDFSPCTFKSFRPTDKNISDFYKAGLRTFFVLSTGTKSLSGLPYSLYGESWIDDETYDFTSIDNQLDLFIKNAPEAYFGVMLVLDTREWWYKKHPGYPDSYHNFGKMMMDPEWNKLANKYLENAVKHIEEKYGDKVYAYLLLCAMTTEWFSMNKETSSHFVEEDIARKGLDIVAPKDSEIDQPCSRILLTDSKDGNLIKYRKYLNEFKSDLILKFASTVKRVTNRNKLVGLYYGYSTEVGIREFIQMGNMEYERIFSSDDIDMILSPVSYCYRHLEDYTSAMVTYSSLVNRNKIYYLENDIIVSDTAEFLVPGHLEKVTKYEDAVASLDREFAYSITLNSGNFWFDMFGGWYSGPGIMERIQKLIAIQNELSKCEMKSNAEIAAVIDVPSMYYSSKNNNFYLSSITDQRIGLGWLGASYDLFSGCDLDMITNQYKAVLFTNLITISEEQDKQIERMIKEGKTIIYVFAPDYIVNGEENLESLCKRTHMNIKKQEFNDSIRYITGEEVTVKQSGPIEDYRTQGDLSFYIDDESVIPMAYYKNSNHVAVGYKKVGDSTIVYCGLGDIPSSVLRQICDMSKIHLYSRNDDNIVNNNDKIINVYHRTKRDAHIYLQDNHPLLDLLTGKEYVPTNMELLIPYNGQRTNLLLRK